MFEYHCDPHTYTVFSLYINGTVPDTKYNKNSQFEAKTAITMITLC